MNKKLDEGYLNMTSIPTVRPAVEDNWYLPEVEDDEFNCGIDCNVAPMVGAQGGQSLSTMAGGEQLPADNEASLDYLLQMAGMDGSEVAPEEIVSVEPVEEPSAPEHVDDIFAIGFEPDFEDSCDSCDFDMDDADYNDILNNSRLEGEAPAISMENDFIPDEVEIPCESEVDMYDGIMNKPEEAIEEPVFEIPTEEPVASEEIVDEPVEEVSETNEANPEDMVLEKQPETNDTEAQQIKDYLVHNKEVLFGPASAKVEKYKKSLDGKSVEELRVEAEEVSPNWKKYIGKYKVNESVETTDTTKKAVLDILNLLNDKITDTNTVHPEVVQDTIVNYLTSKGIDSEEEADKLYELVNDELVRSDIAIMESLNETEISDEWTEIEGNEQYAIKRNETTGEYAVFDRVNGILDDTISTEISTCEKAMEDLSEENPYSDFDSDFDKLAGIESDEQETVRLQGKKVEPTEEDLQQSGLVTAKINEIEWDCDGEDPEDLGLPTRDFTITFAHDGSLDWVEELSNALSDEYGYCHNGYDYEILSIEPDYDEQSELNDYEGNVSDDVKEDVPAGQEILTEEGEEMLEEIPADEGSEMEDTEVEEQEMAESLDDLTKSPIKTTNCVPSELKEETEEPVEMNESEEKTEALNVDVEPEEVKVEETKESDLKHEIPENDMIKDDIDTGEEVKYEVELEGGEIKEFGQNSDIEVKSYITENAKFIKSITVK